MLLNRLKVRNFKRFRDQEIVFQDGITGIVGNNGTGKSSIVTAILFALYGFQGTGIDGDYIVSSFAGPQDVCEIRLDFRAGSNEYTVIRKFKRRPSSTLHEADLYLNNRLLASSVQRVGQEVQRIVGMGAGDFRNTIYAGQKELLTLIESRAGSRKDWFMQVLGIDHIKKDSMEILKGAIDAREEKYQEISGRLQEIDADGARAHVLELKGQLAEAEGELGEIVVTESKAQDSLRQIREERDRLLLLRDRYLQLTKEEEVLIAEIKRFQDECREDEAEVERHARLQEDLDTLSPLADRYETLKADVTAMANEKIRADQLALEVETLKEQVCEYDERRVSIMAEISTLACDEEKVAELARDVEEWHSLKDRIAEIKELQKEYDVLREDLTRMEERFVHTKQRVIENRDDIETVEKKVQHLAALEAEIREYDVLRARDEIYIEADGYAREEKRCLQEAEVTYDKIDQLKREITELSQQIAGVEIIDAEISEAERRRDRLTAQISAFGVRKQAVCDEIKRVSKHQAEIHNAGPEGTCPMCHQSLGEHYEGLLDELTADVALMQEKLADLEEEHAKVNTERREVVARLQELLLQRSDLQHVRERYALCTSHYSQNVEAMQRWQAEAEEHQAKIKDLGLEEYDQAAHDALRRRLRALEEKRVRADTLRGECSRLPALREERGRLIAEVEYHLTQKEKMEDALTQLGFDPQHLRHLEDKAQMLEISYREYTEARTRLSRRSALERDLRVLLERLDEIRSRLQATEHEQRALSFDPERFAYLTAERDRAEKAHRRALELRIRLEKTPQIQKTLEAKRKLLADRDARLSTVRAAIIDLGFDSQDTVTTEKKLVDLEHSLTIVRERRYAVSARVNSLREDIDEVTIRLSRAADLMNRKKSLHEEIGRLKLTRSLIKDFADYLLQVIRGRIEEEAGEVLAEVTDGRYGTVMLDSDFTVFVNDMGEDYPADRFSGGEQDDIAIALRVALSRFLAEVNDVHDSTFLIFDEIFGSQDEERRNNLLRALRTQEVYFPQIILISHITEVQDEFSTTLMVKMGADRTSTVRELE